MEYKELLACKYVDERPEHDGFYDAFITGFEAGSKSETEKIKATDTEREVVTQVLLRFFVFFRNNGEKLIGLSIEQLVDEFLKEDKK